MTENKLNAGKIRRYLKHPVRDIETYEVIGSTNDRARDLLKAGTRCGIVAAVSQTAGRGRVGRSFFSPEGGLYMTVITAPADPDLTMQKLTVAAGVAVYEAVRDLAGIELDIKWVNDLYQNGRKAGGILCESFWQADGSFEGAIAGIGLNVSTRPFPPELQDKACTLTIPDLDRDQLTAAIADHLLSWCEDLASPALIDLYRSRSFLLGRMVRFVRQGADLEGEAYAICDNGNLEVRLADGQVISLSSGEVSLASWSPRE